MVREISKSETRWIYLTNTLQPRGLIVELDLNRFISDYYSSSVFPNMAFNI